MAVLMIISAIPALSVSATDNEGAVVDGQPVVDEVVDEDLAEEFSKAVTYTAYKNGKNSAGADAVVNVTTADEAKTVTEEENNTFIFPVTVEKEGLYTLVFDYRYTDVVEGSDNADANKNTTYSILIDGKLPYQEVYSLKLSRMWKNKEPIKQDANGDDINPKQVPISDPSYWRSYTIYDKKGFETSPLQFYLTAGEHELSFKMNNNNVALRNVTFCGVKELDSYATFLQSHGGAAKYTGENIVMQGEAADVKSEMYLIAQNDITNPLTVPYSPAKIRLNTFGGANWKLTGETAQWSVKVPQAGLYKFSVRFRQNFYDGVSVHRRLLINGEVQYAEANSIAFPYDTEWQTYTLQNEKGEDMYIYLEQGDNTVALEVVLGESAAISALLQDTVLDMNEIYRDIIMITGSSPDDYRDYSIQKQIPDLVDRLFAVRTELVKLSNTVAECYGKDSSLIAKIQNIIRQLDQVIEKPAEIVKSDRLGAFKSNISTIGSWISMFSEQPLEIDRIELYAENGEAPRATANLAESFKHTVDRFIASFTEDYSSMGAVTGSDGTPLKVWIQSGRDQANILKQMITSDFTPKSGIGVNLELVTGAIIEATLAGRGPDIALTRGVTDPVNFAMRGALVDLSKFEDFEEVEGYFVEKALVPFEYKGGTYGLAETMSYQMMFVRTDIMEELGFGEDVPATWDELLVDYYPVVSRNNMEIGIGNMNQISAMNASNIFTNLLYQMGGQLYKDADNDGTLDSTALTSKVGYKAFTTSVELYADYLFPQEYDAMSRFRTGEMPILLADYTMYNTFSITIPELDGLWEMYPIPGFEREDGTIYNDQAATTTGCVMFTGIGDEARQKQGWEFLKWWVSADTQADFGNRIEAVLGSAGRYATANVEAMKRLPWEDDQLEALQKQMESLVFVEQLPGSYFTSRAINSAFMTSVLNSENPIEQLLYWSKQIDMELERKIEEFSD